MFKTHAPKSAHHAIHVNCTYRASPAIGPARQSQLARMGAKVSKQGAKNASDTLCDYIAFAFAVRISHQQCIEFWLVYGKVNFVSLFKGRGKLIKLLKVKCETEWKLGQVRYLIWHPEWMHQQSWWCSFQKDRKLRVQHLCAGTNSISMSLCKFFL